jgi:hypothetical protein
MNCMEPAAPNAEIVTKEHGVVVCFKVSLLLRNSRRS